MCYDAPMKRLLERLLALLCALCLLFSAAGAASREEDTEEELSFSDVSESAWYYEPVRFLAEQGILQGFPDGSFRPGTP